MVKKYWLLLLLPFVGAFDMVAQQGQFVIQGGASVRVSGAPTIRLQKTDWQNNGSASMATSTLVLSGDAASAVISGAASDVFQHLKIATPSGQVALGKNISVQGDLTFESGLLQLDGRNITLDPAGKLENESETSRITSNANGGEISISLSLNAPAAANPGNLGAVITSASDLGTVIVSRGHLAQSGACNAGMNRWLDIQAAQNAGLNATLRLRYFDAELDGISESELTIFRSDDGGATWTDIGFSARNATENWVEQTGLNSLSRFTLGSANQWLSPKTWYEDEDGDTFGNAAVTEMACAPSSNFISNDDDCDDADAARFPGNPEICDGKDNDCDLELPANEADSDGDDFMVCENDCDDTNTAIHPAASETCNGLDDDCD
ncbi:MAG: putative metal-binding motif-containing protein, partial [Saprospiraceae bacterium]